MIEDLQNRFVYHKVDDKQTEIMAHIRQELFRVAGLMDSFSPNSREKSLAITKLEEAMMWFNAGVARNVQP